MRGPRSGSWLVSPSKGRYDPAFAATALGCFASLAKRHGLTYQTAEEGLYDAFARSAASRRFFSVASVISNEFLLSTSMGP